MHLLTLDYETYYDTEFSLSRLTNEAYIRDNRFEVIMVGLQMDDNPAFWVPAPQIPAVFAKIPWHETIVVSHHAHFDMAILSWVYGIRPAFIADTLAMFRAIYPTEAASLANMCQVLGIGEKGHEVENARGKHLQDFDQWALKRYGAYCVNDVVKTRAAFDILKPFFPVSELRLIDLTTRLFTEPTLRLNAGLLQVAYDDERERLVSLFARAFPDLLAEATAAVLTGDAAAWKKLKTPLASNPQFAQMLMDLGVDPPKKLSPAAVKAGIADPALDREPPIGMLAQIDKKTLAAMYVMTQVHHDSEIWTYAFSKSDEHFKQLLEHPNDDVVALTEARFGVKSTIKETRAKAFMGIASRGTFPIYLKYYGAGTGRDGGGDKVNPQNLNKFCPHCQGEKCPRCDDTGISPMRRAIEAPEGHVIVVRDLSAIEARVNFYLAGQEDKVQAYRDGADLYCLAASEVFGRLIQKSDKKERFLGKSEILGCIAEGELVLTDKGLVAIENVTLDMQVWDGVEFVAHTGVMFQGYKEIMTYAGLTATPDHIIFLQNGESCEFRDAASTGASIAQTGDGGMPLRFMGNYEARNFQAENTGASLVPLQVWKRAMGGPLELAEGTVTGVSHMYGEGEQGFPQLPSTGEEIRRDYKSMQQPQEPSIQPLRKEGDSMSVSQQERVHTLRGEELATQHIPQSRDRSEEQQWALRAGEPAVSYADTELQQYRTNVLCDLSGGKNSENRAIPCAPDCGPSHALLPPDHLQPRQVWVDGGTSHRPILQSRQLQTKRTYDITNAGPRNCFTVSGKLVHNCGFGLGWKKYQGMLRVGMLGNAGMLLGEDIAEALGVYGPTFALRNSGYINESLPPNVSPEEHATHCACSAQIIKLFRDNNPEVPKLWQRYQDALPEMIAGGAGCIDAKGIIRYCSEGLILPNGMLIRYVELRGKIEGRHTEYSILKNKRKGERGKVYGGLCCENGTQGTARIILTDAFLGIAAELKKKDRVTNLTPKRYVRKPVHRVHDELLVVVPVQEAEETYHMMGEIMATPPAWAPDLPLASEGGWAKQYIK